MYLYEDLDMPQQSDLHALGVCEDRSIRLSGLRVDAE
jgi:hypothetical protein